MPKLPVISGNDMVKVLAKVGFIHVRTSGSHAILKKSNDEEEKVVPLPLHKELAKGTLLSILHQSGLTREDLMKLLT